MTHGDEGGGVEPGVGRIVSGVGAVNGAEGRACQR